MPERNGFRAWLMRGWYEGEARAWLAPLAVLFAMFTGLRRFAFRHGVFASRHPGVPVIVVGNLTVGGTGKTPLVIWLVGQLQARGVKVGVVLRGHGGSARTPRLVGPDSDPAEAGDEAVLIARRAQCPVAVGHARVAAARLLVDRGCELVLSDDGLQHLAMQRDLEIVVVDGARGFGNGALLPQGPLRELPDRLRGVHAVVINGGDSTGIAATISEPLSMTMAVEALRSVATDEGVPLQSLQGAAWHAVAGTGNPERFFATLRTLGCLPVEHVFADHHSYAPADLAFADQLPIVMTEKDAVKCRAFATERMRYVQASANLPAADAARLLQRVLGCINKGERIHA